MSKKDLRLMIGDVKFSVRAAAVLKKDNKILFQQKKGDKVWALPGGAIEVLERAKDVLKRELEEEWIEYDQVKWELEGQLQN